MRHPTHLHTSGFDWAKTRLVVFSQDEGFCFLVRQTFRKLNIREVMSSGNPAEAERFLAHGPDAALVDVDGDCAHAMAFLAHLRAQVPDLPVLMVARPANRQRVTQAEHLGIDGYMPKPVSAHELSHRVTEVIKTPRAAPVPSAPATPPPQPAAARLSGGTLGDDEVSPSGKSAGFYGEDLAGASVAAKPDVVKALPEPVSGQGSRQWQDELAASGHVPRTGKDVAKLDVATIVAAHGQWLGSKGAAGKRAEFKGMDLAGGDLSDVVLANAGFRDADLSDARLAGARLDGADFRHATLSAADLSGANLAVAQLRHANLELANLEGASLRGADLSGAKLREAKLAGADFTGATLVGTDLTGADLSQAENLSQAQVDKARCGSGTKLPPGLRRPEPD